MARAAARVWCSISAIVTRRGVGITEHNHAQRIAHQDERHAAFIEQPGHGKIVGGERGDFFAAPFMARMVSAVILVELISAKTGEQFLGVVVAVPTFRRRYPPRDWKESRLPVARPRRQWPG